MEISIYDFLKAVDESNGASEMALRYAVLILEDFSELSKEGRGLMADTLMDLISGKRERPNRECLNNPKII